MELIVILVIGLPLALAIWIIVRTVKARDQIDDLSRRLAELEGEVAGLRRREPDSAVPVRAADESSLQPAPPPLAAARPIASPVIEPVPHTPPPPLPPRIERFEEVPPVSRPSPSPAINWEQFMGVKGFAWMGGFALFLGIAFFIKYSFDNNLVPPQLRAALGFLSGLALVAGGVWLSRKPFPVLAQTLCATGVLVLYAVTFACRSIYHFELFGPVLTFLFMALITSAAFLLAVRSNALVVAILGMLGGFLTPFLLSTGQDNPLGLFTYVALLDIGLILIALNRRWHFLTALAALGTAVTQIAWANQFFTPEKYNLGNKILIVLGVLLGFNVLYLAANGWARRRLLINPWLTGGNLGLAAVALLFVPTFFNVEPLIARPVLLFTFAFLIDLVVAAVVRMDARVAAAQPIAGLMVFGILALWTTQHLTEPLLPWALTFYFVFALFHCGLPALLERTDGNRAAGLRRWNHFFPPLALLLVLIPIFQLPELSFLVWPFILLVDLLALGLAALTATLLPVLLILLLTFAATGALLFKIPLHTTELPGSFYLLGFFALFFVAATVWLVKKVAPEALSRGPGVFNSLNSPQLLGALLPASSAALPFLLLIMVTARLPLTNPSSVFSLALLLVLLLIGLATLFALDALPLVALVGLFAVECTWHMSRLDPLRPNSLPVVSLAWYLVFLGVFAVFPFLFRNRFANRKLPWVAAALAGPAQFFLVHRLVKLAWPNEVMGLLPAAFALPALLSLFLGLRKTPSAGEARLSQTAWFGGVALFFVTLIFPIQFDRQWVTLGWALEGAALLWLFQRVPHPGLRLTGVGLLLAAFLRLTVNPAVPGYHLRETIPIFNWYLYTYGITTICLFLGARLLAPPRHIISSWNVQATLAALGTVLAFVLMNIEIADYFSAPESRLTFQFTGNFARDMTYSISWGLFALALLLVGIVRMLRGARYAAMALLCATLLKLFLHDLARLGPLYRIGAFVGVALIAMLASFAYQKFFTARDRNANLPDQPPS